MNDWDAKSSPTNLCGVEGARYPKQVGTYELLTKK